MVEEITWKKFITGLTKQGRAIMAELGIERPPPVSHSELTAGHDVTQLLSQINDNLKQSKADQILRLLRDQDKVTNNLDDSFADDAELLREYEQIREEKVICDSDTLTDSSSGSSDLTSVVDVHETKVMNHNNINNSGNKNISEMQEKKSDPFEGREKGYRRHRARTSVGFHNDMNSYDNNDSFSSNNTFDTRDLSLRPKSSYVRRHQYRKRDEVDAGGGQMAVEDYVEQPPLRPSRSARPKSRLGRTSVPRSERTIALVEADTVTTTETHVSTKEELLGPNRLERFSGPRQPKRESKRAKAFCDTDNVSQHTNEVVSTESSASVLMDTGENITEVQTISPDTNVHTTQRVSHVSSFTQGSVPRNSPVQMHVHQRRIHQNVTRTEQNVIHSPQQPVNHQPAGFQPPGVPMESHLMRSDTITSNATMRSEKRENISPHSQVPLKRNNSNLGDARPRNPEPVTSRPIERPDVRPSTRTRRLHRRYMAPTQSSQMSNNRPTSESVILARQKTEKNLLKKQAENRPHSEKIMINSQNKNIDVSLNPTQGPQTLITSKGGVTQASHVQGGGFRGYDPGSRLKSSAQARDLPSDLTLPRHGQNSMLAGGRKPLAALMKLPPLEASLAAKKKERGLTLAARETCV